MKLLLITLASLSTSALANPIVTAVVEKTWERCVISAGAESSTVSCAVGYQGKAHLNNFLIVTVPIILPWRLQADPAKALESVKARLEIGETVLKAHEITFGTTPSDPLMPDGTVKASLKFLASVPSKAFSMVVSYEQPTIDGKVYYLPKFEKGKNPKDHSEFSVSVFPAGQGLLTLESKHKEKATSFATRVTVKPVHNEIIKIGYNREQAAPSDGDKPPK
jgi:hypothetical protein